MRLYEFDDDSQSSIAKIVIVADQLKNDAKRGKLKDWDLDRLINYFQSYDIILNPTDLYDMIKKPPLNDLIDNIQGDKIVWKGRKKASLREPSETEKTVKGMAKKALKR